MGQLHLPDMVEPDTLDQGVVLDYLVPDFQSKHFHPAQE